MDKIKKFGNTLLKFYIDGINDDLLKKYFANEMLSKGMLASNVIYLSTAHNKTLLNKYLIAIDETLFKLKKLNKIF